VGERAAAHDRGEPAQHLGNPVVADGEGERGEPGQVDDHHGGGVFAGVRPRRGGRLGEVAQEVVPARSRTVAACRG
jgi:hypothetical protein